MVYIRLVVITVPATTVASPPAISWNFLLEEEAEREHVLKLVAHGLVALHDHSRLKGDGEGRR